MPETWLLLALIGYCGFAAVLIWARSYIPQKTIQLAWIHLLQRQRQNEHHTAKAHFRHQPPLVKIHIINHTTMTKYKVIHFQNGQAKSDVYGIYNGQNEAMDALACAANAFIYRANGGYDSTPADEIITPRMSHSYDTHNWLVVTN